MASDGGPGTQCRRWARAKDGFDSTGARFVIVKELGGFSGRELWTLNDAVLRERTGGIGDRDRRKKSPRRLGGTCSTTNDECEKCLTKGTRSGTRSRSVPRLVPLNFKMKF